MLEIKTLVVAQKHVFAAPKRPFFIISIMYSVQTLLKLDRRKTARSEVLLTC